MVIHDGYSLKVRRSSLYACYFSYFFSSHLRWCFAVRDRELIPLVWALLSDSVL